MTVWQPKTPKLTVDIVIRVNDGIILIKRKNRPYGWALPGGFVDVGETVEHAAIREAKEETGLSIHNLSLLGVYSDPDRDPRFHTVSVVFTADANGNPKGGDDAAEAKTYQITNLPSEIVFDHKKIINDAQKTK